MLGGVSSARRTACTYQGLAAAATTAWGAGAGRLAWNRAKDAAWEDTGGVGSLWSQWLSGNMSQMCESLGRI